MTPRIAHRHSPRFSATGAARVGALAVLALSAAAGIAVTATSTRSAAASESAAADSTFAVDTLHSTALFKIKHMNTSNFYGVFNDFSGEFSAGEGGVGINVTVKAASVESRNPKRNDHITGPDFFSAKEFPTISIVAKGLKAGSADTWSGNGDITFRGVTKPVKITVTKTGEGKSRDGKNLLGVEARATIKRSDFGNDFMVGPLSDEVELIGAFEGVAK